MSAARAAATAAVWGSAFGVTFYACTFLGAASPWAVVTLVAVVFWTVSQAMSSIWRTDR